MLQDEYYVIDRENNDNHPLFAWDQGSVGTGAGKPVSVTDLLQFRLRAPVSPKFEWVDYHKAPEPVVSKKIVDVLESLDVYGIQLIPSIVRNDKDPNSEPKNYWFVHVWNRISCIDRAQSDLDIDEVDGGIWDIEKLVLDEKILDMLELKKRLIFELAEKTSVLIVHQSIKDSIMAVSPQGCRFFKVREWNSDSSFD